MASIRIWTLESDNDTKAVESLANNMVENLKLDDLSIQTVSSKAFLLSNRSGKSLNGDLKKAIRHYLKQDDYVIFLADSKGSVPARPYSQKAEALIEEIKKIVANPGFVGKVFFALGIQELEARLWRTHLGIEDPCRAARMDYAEARFRELCASRGLDWDGMTETDRENFVDDLIHEDRECRR